MSYKLLLLFVLFACNFAFAANPKKRIFTDTLPSRFILNQADIREHTFNRIPKTLNTDVKSYLLYRFSNEQAVGICKLLESGDIYSDWYELENYLNSILDRMKLTDELKADKYLHIYIHKEGSMNAFTTSTGFIFFNIGMLQYLKSEAEIAAVVAHELSHYILNHSVKKVLKYDNGDFDFNIVTDFKSKYKYNVSLELEADSLGLMLMKQSGFNTYGTVKAIEVNKRIQDNYIKSVPSVEQLKEITHPSNPKRKANAQRLIEKFKLDSLPDESCRASDLITRFAEESKIEILEAHLENFEFSDCFEKAFIFHLFDPENTLYHYYLLEGIRRYCYFDTKHWSENFITNNYYTSSDLEGEKGDKYPVDYTILEKFDLNILPIDPSDGVKIKTRHYWKQEPLFKTYEQAYNYFYDLGAIKYNNAECHFSNALSLGFDSIKRNELLKKYIEYENIANKEYANALLNNKKREHLGDKTLYVMADMFYHVLNGSDKIGMNRAFMNKNGILNKTLRNSIVNDSLSTTIILDDLKYNNHKMYKRLKLMESLSLSHLRQNSELDLSYIFPELWEVFNFYNVKVIVFDTYLISIREPRNSSLEELKKVYKCDPEKMYFDTKDDKYISSFYSVYYLTKKGFRNNYDGKEDETIDKKQDVSTQISNHIKRQIIIRNKKMLRFY